MARVRQFGNTWWGKAWLEALEQRALVDPNRLPRGRTYARQDRVQNLELSPGLLRAKVWGTDRYNTTLSLRVLTDAEWDELLDVVMERASNVAALLAGEVPSEIGDAVLPDRGELGPGCSCPDSAEPCKHVAALCYVAADLLDEDPFALLTLRGRSRDAVLTEVRARRSERLGVKLTPSSDHPRGPDPGTSAAQAFRREPSPVTRSPRLGPQPGEMLPLAVAPSADAGIDRAELTALVNDAAARAWSMLAGGTSSGLDLSVGADVVRRAAGSDPVAIAEATGLDQVELQAAVAAWRLGGEAGYRVHISKEDPGPEALEAGRRALGERAKVRANVVSSGTTQLRLAEDNRWWRFIADDELGWLLADGPADDPNDLLEPGR